MTNVAKRSKIINAKTSSDVLKLHRELALRLKGERTLANVKPLCGVKNKRKIKAAFIKRKSN